MTETDRTEAEDLLNAPCLEGSGALLIVELDGFGKTGGEYGGNASGQILVAFKEIIGLNFRSGDIVCEICEHEYAVYLRNVSESDGIRKIIRRLNAQLRTDAVRILGENASFASGIFCGAVITKGGRNYSELFRTADRALLEAKVSGKNECIVLHDDSVFAHNEARSEDLLTLCASLEEHSVSHGALYLDREAFGSVYRYMLRHMERYGGCAGRVLLTVVPTVRDMREAELSAVISQFGKVLGGVLRSSDIMMQSSADSFFLLLPTASGNDIGKIIGRVSDAWRKEDVSESVVLTYVSDAINK